MLPLSERRLSATGAVRGSWREWLAARQPRQPPSSSAIRWDSSTVTVTARLTSATRPAEWSSSRQRTGPTPHKGRLVAFITHAAGVDEGAAHMVIMPDGNVGIGTFNDIPTIADKLQVFGDIRVGTTGTNGCLRNFAGTGIAGSCSSDRRFKKDITPFSHVLEQVTALQPVHYFWRAAEFPDAALRRRPRLRLDRAGRRAGAARARRRPTTTGTRRSTTASCRCSPFRPSRN